MKQILLTTLITLAVTLATAQSYDSLTNIPPTKISCLYGQKATVVELNELYPDPEWTNKITNPEIIGQQFSVTSASRDTKHPQIWIQLVNKGDTIYYRLTSTNMQHPPILINGFYEKQKRLYTNCPLHLRMDNEYTTTEGNTKLFNTTKQFTCTGLELLRNEASDIVPSYLLTTGTDTIAVPLTGFETDPANTIDRFSKL